MPTHSGVEVRSEEDSPLSQNVTSWTFKTQCFLKFPVESLNSRSEIISEATTELESFLHSFHEIKTEAKHPVVFLLLVWQQFLCHHKLREGQRPSSRAQRSLFPSVLLLDSITVCFFKHNFLIQARAVQCTNLKMSTEILQKQTNQKLPIIYPLVAKTIILQNQNSAPLKPGRTLRLSYSINFKYGGRFACRVTDNLLDSPQFTAASPLNQVSQGPKLQINTFLITTKPQLSSEHLNLTIQPHA